MDGRRETRGDVREIGGRSGEMFGVVGMEYSGVADGRRFRLSLGMGERGGVARESYSAGSTRGSESDMMIKSEQR